MKLQLFNDDWGFRKMKQKVFPQGFALSAWPSHVQICSFSKGRWGNKDMPPTSASHFRGVEIYSRLLSASVPDTSQLDCEQAGYIRPARLLGNTLQMPVERKETRALPVWLLSCSAILSASHCHKAHDVQLPGYQQMQWNASVIFFGRQQSFECKSWPTVCMLGFQTVALQDRLTSAKHTSHELHREVQKSQW